MARRLAVLAIMAVTLPGCGPNPVLDPYKPDPTPLPIAAPSDRVMTYFPENRAYYQYLPSPAIGKAVALQILSRAAMPESGWSLPVFLEVDRLTDADVIAELCRAAGRGVQVVVILDDDEESLAAMQRTIDDLSGAGVQVVLPHRLDGGGAAAL